MPKYTFILRKKNIRLELSSEDSAFVTKQMNKWQDTLLSSILFPLKNLKAAESTEKQMDVVPDAKEEEEFSEVINHNMSESTAESASQVPDLVDSLDLDVVQGLENSDEIEVVEEQKDSIEDLDAQILEAQMLIEKAQKAKEALVKETEQGSIEAELPKAPTEPELTEKDSHNQEIAQLFGEETPEVTFEKKEKPLPAYENLDIEDSDLENTALVNQAGSWKTPDSSLLENSYPKVAQEDIEITEDQDFDTLISAISTDLDKEEVPDKTELPEEDVPAFVAPNLNELENESAVSEDVTILQDVDEEEPIDDDDSDSMKVEESTAKLDFSDFLEQEISKDEEVDEDAEAALAAFMQQQEEAETVDEDVAEEVDEDAETALAAFMQQQEEAETVDEDVAEEMDEDAEAALAAFMQQQEEAETIDEDVAEEVDEDAEAALAAFMQQQEEAETVDEDVAEEVDEDAEAALAAFMQQQEEAETVDEDVAEEPEEAQAALQELIAQQEAVEMAKKQEAVKAEPPKMPPKQDLASLLEQPGLSSVEEEEPELSDTMTYEEFINTLSLKTPVDLLLSTAFYMEQYEGAVKFTTRDISTRTIKAFKKQISPNIILASVNKGFIEVVPDFTGTAESNEYTLTDSGREYIVNELS